ncbi:MAG: hypothetical protein CEE38_03155 [Planctomycetes bacterium B3_Pla]|nr:MAG: hypothetical protein CEE38_03155 [Planctomycetes bacterium B3_Pla]
MMRRLAVLIFVLALTSTANAVLIEVDGQVGQTFEVQEKATITVVSEDGSSWLGYLIVEAGGAGGLSNVLKLDAAGNIADAVPYTVEPEWGLGFELTVAMSPGGDPAVAAGPQFSFDYTGAVGETARISLFVDPEYTTPVATVSLDVVPEPMTVILLGLGALFLRRRR